jgi:hypothetical protein
MLRCMISLVVTVTLVGPSGQASADADTSPGRSAVFASATGVPLLPVVTELLSATIAQGKRKRILTIDAMLVADDPGIPAFQVLVNGVPPEPSDGSNAYFVAECPTSGFGCLASATFWLDLDAADATAPGTFIRQPIVVTIHGGDDGGGGLGLVDVSLRARLEKK